MISSYQPTPYLMTYTILTLHPPTYHPPPSIHLRTHRNILSFKLCTQYDFYNHYSYFKADYITKHCLPTTYLYLYIIVLFLIPPMNLRSLGLFQHRFVEVYIRLTAKQSGSTLRASGHSCQMPARQGTSLGAARTCCLMPSIPLTRSYSTLCSTCSMGIRMTSVIQ